MNGDVVVYQLGVKPGLGHGLDRRGGIGITHDHVEVIRGLPLEAQGLEAVLVVSEGSIDSGCWRHGHWAWVGRWLLRHSIEAIVVRTWCWSRLKIGMRSGGRAIVSNGVCVGMTAWLRSC